MNEPMNELASNVDESSQNMLNQKQEDTSLVVFQVFYQHSLRESIMFCTILTHSSFKGCLGICLCLIPQHCLLLFSPHATCLAIQ